MSRSVEIVPSILSADMVRLGKEIEAARTGGASAIHVDVMDGHFVPNISIGIPVVRSLRRATELLLDVHLMIENPDQYIPEFVQAGADRVSVHQEAVPHLDRAIQLIRSSGAEPGVAINPATPVETLSVALEVLDFVLVMSVNPGFGGQSFIPYTLKKIRQLDWIRREKGLSFSIEVDGGLGHDNIAEAVRSGADWIVAGSSVFGGGDARGAVESLRRVATDAALSRI